VTVAGVSRHPNEEWMVQMARNAVDVIDGPLLPVRFVLHDRNAKFSAPFRSVLYSSAIEPIRLPPRSPNLNAFAERSLGLASYPPVYVDSRLNPALGMARAAG
jgi:putative transposase